MITFAETRGGVVTRTLYTYKGNQLRIEETDKSVLEPANVIDFAGRTLTIIYPHNSTFITVDLTGAQSPAPAGAADLPPGLPQPGVGPTSVMSPPPGFPTPPPMPSMPPRPDVSLAGGAPGMPAMMPGGPMPMGAPGMPPMMMAGFNAKPGLQKTGETKRIEGFDCTRYAVSDRMETFEIWATNDSALFPFRPLNRAYQARRFGPVTLEERGIELLREKSLFPMEGVLKIDGGGPEILSFRVDKIERRPIDDPKLFRPPEGFLKTNVS